MLRKILMAALLMGTLVILSFYSSAQMRQAQQHRPEKETPKTTPYLQEPKPQNQPPKGGQKDKPASSFFPGCSQK